MLYDLTVPAYQNGLKALSGELSKASAWGADNGIGVLLHFADLDGVA